MGRLLIVFGAGLVAGGVAAGAGAQEENWEFTLEGGVGTAANPLRPGQATATVVLWARFDPAWHAFAGARLDAHASETGWSNPRLTPLVHWPGGFGLTPGEVSGPDVLGIVQGQLHIGPFVADPSNPIALWFADFTVADFTPREISLSTTTEEFVLFGVLPGTTSGPLAVEEGRGVIHVIPAPASVGLLGLGGAVCARRRRRRRAGVRVAPKGGRAMRSIHAAIVAFVASATAASAQTEGYWVFELSNPVLSPSNPSTTVTLRAGFPRSDYAFAGARLSVHATESGWSDLRLLPVQIPPAPVEPPFPDPFGRHAGVISGGDVTGIVHGQLHGFPGSHADPSNPMPLWRATFTVSDFTQREISLSTTTTDFFVYPHSISPTSEPRTVDEGAGLIFVIPAPSALALLGLGLAATRRRRCAAGSAVRVIKRRFR